MSLIIVSSFLVGAVLGLRFTVMAVVPANVAGALAVVMGAMLLDHSATSVVLAVLGFSAALQGGYMFGSFTRFTLAAMRVARVSTARAPLKASQ